jgi:3-keto-disaccharide hydrolase
MRQTLGFLSAAACAVALSNPVGNLAAQQAPAAGAQPAAAGQQPPAGQPQEGGRGRGRGGGGGGIPVLPFEDRTGFESMFNGTSLDPGEQQIQAARKAQAEAQAALPPGERGRGRGGRGGGPPISRFMDWNGDPKFWRVENGAIVGESTPDKVVGPNTFLIWRGGTPGDFELKAEIRMNSTNSGIQYRSKMLAPNEGGGDQPGHAWRIGGYQMDMDFSNNFPGILYEEGGRGFLAERGKITYIAPDGTKSTIGQLESAEALAATFKPGEWNQFHLIARGNTLIHIVNGHVTAVCIDDDLKARSMAGLIGFQLHAGAPMKLELRNVAIKLK